MLLLSPRFELSTGAPFSHEEKNKEEKGIPPPVPLTPKFSFRERLFRRHNLLCNRNGKGEKERREVGLPDTEKAATPTFPRKKSFLVSPFPLRPQ